MSNSIFAAIAITGVGIFTIMKLTFWPRQSPDTPGPDNNWQRNDTGTSGHSFHENGMSGTGGNAGIDCGDGGGD